MYQTASALAALVPGRRRGGGAAGLLYPPALSATAADVRGVRQLLGESQTVFAARWGRCRRSVIRWERWGHRFLTTFAPGAAASHAEIWETACREACQRWRIERET